MAFRAFLKRFEAPQRSVEIKISVNFSLCSVSDKEGLIGPWATWAVALGIFKFFDRV